MKNLEVRHIFIFVALAFWGAYGAVLAFITIPEGNRDMFIAWGASVGSVVSIIAAYYWGQSSPRNKDTTNADK